MVAPIVTLRDGERQCPVTSCLKVFRPRRMPPPGKSAYCSDACRAKMNRTKRAVDEAQRRFVSGG